MLTACVMLSSMTACYDRELSCRVSWSCDKKSSELAACQKWSVSWLRDKMSSELAACQKYWVWWPRAILSSFMTECYDIEFYDRELCYRTSWPRAWMSSHIKIDGWVYWPRAMLSSQLARASMSSHIKIDGWVYSPQGMMSSLLVACQLIWFKHNKIS